MRRSGVHNRHAAGQSNYRIVIPLKFRRFSDGFSLAEILVIIAIMAILMIITAPNIANLLDGTRLAESVVDVRTAFMEAQRQAIRSGAPCAVELARIPRNSAVRSACIAQRERALIEQIRIQSNIGDEISHMLTASNTLMDNCGNGGGDGNGNGCQSPTTPNPPPPIAPNPYPPIRIGFGILGTAKFAIDPDTPNADATGQIVFTLHERNSLEPRCLAISSTLGLTRTGIYRGTWPGGTCNASETGR